MQTDDVRSLLGGHVHKTHGKAGLQVTIPKYLNPSIDNCSIGLHSFNPRGVVSRH